MSFRNLAGPVLLLLSGALTAQQAEQPAGEAPARIRAFTTGCEGGIFLDFKSNRSVCTNVDITDGEIRITAAEGTTDETSFEDSEWLLSGDVLITFGTAALTAETARFVFRSNELVSGELSGDPVEITDYIEQQEAPVRGTADALRFDNAAQTAELSGRATLALGANQYSGCDLIYHLTDKTARSGSSDCGVTVVYYPEDEEPASQASQSP